jgi:hypothetical protein
MTTLTIELPDALVQQISAKKVSQQRLESAIIEFVELYLKESDKAAQSGELAWSDPHEFAHRVIANNRELFEKLARLP